MSALHLPMLKARWRTWRTPAAVFLAPGLEVRGDAPGQAVPGHEDALLAWRDWCAAHAGERCLVGLSSRWLLTGVLPQAQAKTSAQASVEAWGQWDHYFNIGPAPLDAGWQVRAVQAGGAWLVCAMPGTILADVQAVARAHRVAIAWVGPWWAQGGQRWLASVDSADLMHAREPGWCLSLNRLDGKLAGVWAQQDPPDEQAGGRVPAVHVSVATGPGQTRETLWDDPATGQVLSGRASAWLGVA